MDYCIKCGRSFVSHMALLAHCRDKADHFYCKFCDSFFEDRDDLQQVRAAVLSIYSSKTMMGINAVS